VLNELVQNAIKHAFPTDRGGSITVRLKSDPQGTTITVCDDGVGLPEGFDLLKTRTLGLQITKRIVESDLGGILEVASHGGTQVTIGLPPALVHQEVEQP
jgi:two-component sensor histidine kinase